MLAVFDAIRGMDYLSLFFRLLIAALCGAAIGMERSLKNRPAGLRTHILVCLGGAVAAVTGHYLYLGLHLPADITRMSGQVITGLGFIGAGTILVTKSLSVKGLTTAAGIWTVGIIGIAVGSGYYEGGILATALVLLTQTLIARLDKRIQASPKYTLTVRYNEKSTLGEVMRRCGEQHLAIRSFHVQKDPSGEAFFIAEITLQGGEATPSQLDGIRQLPDVVSLSLQS